MTPANPTTLVGLISSIPDDQTAIIQPEQNIRISYGSLKRQVQDVADALAAAGVNRGDRDRHGLAQRPCERRRRSWRRRWPAPRHR